MRQSALKLLHQQLEEPRPEPPPDVWEVSGFCDPSLLETELDLVTEATTAPQAPVWKPYQPRERWPGAPPHIKLGIRTVENETGTLCSCTLSQSPSMSLPEDV